MRKFLIDEINKNGKKYILYLMIIIVGIFIGTFYFSKSYKNENSYVTIEETINFIKNGKIDYSILLANYLKRDLLELFILIFISISLLYKYGSYIFFCYKGFTFGFLISFLIRNLTGAKGILFSFGTILLPNIIKIPVFLFGHFYLALLFKSIIDRDYDNKYTILKELIVKVGAVVLIIIINCFFNTFIFNNILVIFKNIF